MQTTMHTWGVGKEREERTLPHLGVTAGRPLEKPLAHPLTAQMGMRPRGPCDFLKVTGCLGAEPGHCCPCHTWLCSLSSGIQGTAGPRSLKDHVLVLRGYEEGLGRCRSTLPGSRQPGGQQGLLPSTPNTFCVFFFFDVRDKTMIHFFLARDARGAIVLKAPSDRQGGGVHDWPFFFLLRQVPTGTQELSGVGWDGVGCSQGCSSLPLLGIFAGGFCTSYLSSCWALSAPERPFAMTS